MKFPTQLDEGVENDLDHESEPLLLDTHSPVEPHTEGRFAFRRGPSTGVPSTPRRQSGYLGSGSGLLRIITSASWRTLMKEVESLDCADSINAVSLATQRAAEFDDKPHYIRPSKLRGLVKWIVNALIGITVGLTAGSMEYIIDVLTAHRIALVQSLHGEGTRPGGDGSPQPPVDATMGLSDTWMRPCLVYMLSCACCIMVTACILTRWAPAAAGSGVSMVMAYLNGVHVPKLLAARTLLVKVSGTVLTVVSGLPLGPEGPLVHIGSGVASFFTRQHSVRLCGRVYSPQACAPSWLDMFTSDRDRREFISSGAAVGLAAAFGAPIGGVLFSLEEASTFWSQRVTWRALLCTTLGTFALSFFHGSEWKNGAPGLLNFEGIGRSYLVWELVPFALISMLGGVLGALFVHAHKRLHAARKWMHNSGHNATKVVEAVCITVVVAAASFGLSHYVGICFPRPQDPEKDYGVQEGTFLQLGCPPTYYNDLGTLFMSYRGDVIDLMMQLPACNRSQTCEYKQRLCPHSECVFTDRSLAVFFVMNFAFMIMAFGIAVPSGLFMPSIMTGAALGGLVGKEVHIIASNMDWTVATDEAGPGLYALVGATAMLSGVFRSSISLAVIIVEGTGQIQYLLPIILSIGVAKLFADCLTDGLNEVTLELAQMPFLHHNAPREMSLMMARHAMRTDVKMFRAVERAGVIVDTLQSCSHNGFPVCTVERDANGRTRWLFEGIILRSQLIVMLSRRVLHGTLLARPRTPSPRGRETSPRGTRKEETSIDDEPCEPAMSWLRTAIDEREEDDDLAMDLPPIVDIDTLSFRRSVSGGGTTPLSVGTCQVSHSSQLKSSAHDDVEVSSEDGVWSGRRSRGSPSLSSGDSAKSSASMLDMKQIDRAMRDYHHRYNFHSRSVSTSSQKIEHIGLSASERCQYAGALGAALCSQKSRVGGLQTHAALRYLSPYANFSPICVRDNCALSRIFTYFRSMTIRHLVVVDRHNEVVGIITRKDLVRFQHGAGAGHDSPHSPPPRSDSIAQARATRERMRQAGDDSRM